jgi:hypothetical protein
MRIQQVFGIFGIFIFVSLSGCGGGDATPTNGGTIPATAIASTNFPLLNAYKSRVNSGATDSFSVSGTCSGSATLVSGAASTGTFEGVAGLNAGQTFSANFTNCTPTSSAVTSTNYYDSSYAPLGSIIPNTEYSRYQALPQGIPSTVKVGDTAVLATLDVYTNSTKAVKTGQRVVSYVVEQDTSNSVFVTLITRSFNTSNQLLFTQQSKYRLSDVGTLTIVSIDVQYSTTSTNRLIYTKL